MNDKRKRLKLLSCIKIYVNDKCDIRNELLQRFATQVSKMTVDDKNSNSTSILLDLEIPAPSDVRLECMPSYSLASKDTFTNTSWTNQTSVNISQLSPFTLYNITVYVRVAGSSVVHPPSLYTIVQTKMDGPSAPWNVTLKQLSPAQVLVNWNSPVRTNGVIINYRVTVSPTSPPYSMKAKSKQHIVSYAFAAAVNYTFNVVAENGFSSGPKSTDAYLVLDSDAIIPIVTDLRIEQMESSWAHLTWSRVANVSGYTVTTKSSNRYASYPTLNTTETETSCNVSGLSPHTRYTFEVSAVRKHFNGPAALVVNTSSGQPLPTVRALRVQLLKGERTSVVLTWQPVVSKRNAKWEYAVYYGASLKVIIIIFIQIIIFLDFLCLFHVSVLFFFE